MTNLLEAWQNIEAHLKASAESAVARVESDLPAVAKFIADASANPIVTAIAQAEHLGGATEFLATVAGMITAFDQQLGAAKAAAAAEAQAAAQAAAEQPPA